MIEPCHSASDLISWFSRQERNERITWEDLPGVTVVHGPEITGQDRWATHHEAVFRMGDGSFVEASWAQPATKYQDQDPNMDLWEVEPYTEAVTKYRRKAT